MRHLLLALPVILLPLSYSQAHEDHHHHDHEQASSLGAHEHGAARLNAALDGDRLELEFDSPAINLLGFEHAPASDADEARIAHARAQLERPHGLFGLPPAADCTVSEQRFEGELLGASHAGYQRQDRHDHDHDHDEAATQQHTGHSDIEAYYQFSCSNPEALQALELRGLFESFPGTEKIQVQLIGPNGQQGAELTPDRSQLPF
ncbi:putative zinc-binding protein [Pseudomonas sp. BAY1663]|uniref:DUF2796 domain-containing protein n=1 Tax=Pseudomonas sp. BAY1663 TaxID=1439940 RepID=UPI00042E0AC5|nr:DUF2796 domain-containing protein [Pseudomonas sp. BAY1663]EXF43018.1 putative zinc-binding protein [Pseudomonas sp. BAY1663]